MSVLASLVARIPVAFLEQLMSINCSRLVLGQTKLKVFDGRDFGRFVSQFYSISLLQSVVWAVVAFHCRLTA